MISVEEDEEEEERKSPNFPPQNPHSTSSQQQQQQQQNQKQEDNNSSPPQEPEPQKSPKILTLELAQEQKNPIDQQEPEGPVQDDMDSTPLSPTAASTNRRGGGGSKRKKLHPSQVKKWQEKVALLKGTVKLVPFVPGKSLDFSSHEILLKRLCLWDFVHLRFDTHVREDLVLQLIASFQPKLRYGYVNGVRINVTCADLARALKLLVRNVRSGGVVGSENVGGSEAEGKGSEEDEVGFVEDLLSNWVLLHDDTLVMPSDMINWTKLVKERDFEKLDWAKMVWFMVKEELMSEPEVNKLRTCYYASHLQCLIRSQREDLFQEEPVMMEVIAVKEDEGDEEHVLEQENDDVGRLKEFCDKSVLGEHNVELSLGGQDNLAKDDGVEGVIERICNQEEHIDEEKAGSLQGHMDEEKACDREGYMNEEKVCNQEEHMNEEKACILEHINKNMENRCNEEVRIGTDQTVIVDKEALIGNKDGESGNEEAYIGKEKVQEGNMEVHISNEEDMDFGENKEIEQQWVSSSMDGYFLQRCTAEVADEERDVKRRWGDNVLGEEEKEGEGSEEEEADMPEDVGFNISTEGGTMEGVISENLIATMEATQIPFSSGLQIHDNISSGEFLASTMGTQIITDDPSLFRNGNGNKRELEPVNNMHHHSVNGGNKRMRTDMQQSMKPTSEFDMCMEQIQQLMGKSRMMYEAKEEAYQQLVMSQQMLFGQGQGHENTIQQLFKEKMEEQHKRDSYIYRLERELYMMGKLLEGYRKALKERNREFAEYRAKCPIPDKPIYRDAGPGGLVLSTTELESLRLKQEEEETRNRTLIARQIKEFEGWWVATFVEYENKVNLLTNRLGDIKKHVLLLKEMLAERKALVMAVCAPVEEDWKTIDLSEVST